MTQEVATQLLHCQTSKDLWEAAKNLSGAHTRSRVTLFKSEFQRTRLGSLKMEEYLNKMKAIADNLAMAGSPISNYDLTTQILAGLDNEYNPIVVQLSEKDNLTWVDLQASLLTFEARLEQLNAFANLTINSNILSAKVAKTESKGSQEGV